MKKNIFLGTIILFLTFEVFGNVEMAKADPATNNAPVNKEYSLMEGIPGFIEAGEIVDFPTYIMAIYKFGLWTIGICAMFMITLGGYMYLTSAGNASSTGKAKGIITDAIIGLVLALTSYLLLYTINPDLVKFNSVSPESNSINSNAQCPLTELPGE